MSGAAYEPKGTRDPLGPIEQAAAAEEVLSSIRHDLRNRLATVRNAVYYIKRKLAGSELCAQDPRIVQFLEVIDNEIIVTDATISEGRAGAHFLDMIAPSKSASTPREDRLAQRASVSTCIERAVALSRIESRALRFDTTIEDGEVEMDPDILAMSLRCIIENAAEAMPDGGVVTISAAPNGPLVRIEVTDEGKGLPENAGEAIYQPFFTTKPGHLGLGLSMASRAARRAGGRLSVRQGPNGAVAAMLIPLLKNEQERPEKG